MHPPLRALATTLIAGAFATTMLACSRELPIEPADKPGAGPIRAAIGPTAVPSNDDFDDAIEVTGLPFTHSVDTREATTAEDDPDDCAGTGPTVWYRFTPSDNVQIEATTFGSNYDTDLAVYVGTRGSLTQIACNDDSGSLQSRVVFDALAGETYFLMVGAFAGGPGGDLVFNVDVAPPPPPPLEVDLTVDPSGTVNPATGEATIRGTITCSRLAFVSFLSGSLQQRIGRTLVRGFFSEGSFECNGATPWTAAGIRGENGLFVAGPVEVFVFAEVYDPETEAFYYDEESRTVRLRGGR